MKTVLGDISTNEIHTVLCHEHICCYSEYLYMMSGKDYLDIEKLEEKAVAELRELKLKYGLDLFVDCTPINIGRNIELLKRVSENSGVHIVCSTGFYYTDEPVLYLSSAETLAEHMIKDAKSINSGIIKAAVENEALSNFNIKLLTATALAQKELNLPITVHTNANNKNGLKALEVLLNSGVKPEKITIGHLSDTDNMDFILEIAKSGCYIGFDRMYDIKSDEYMHEKSQGRAVPPPPAKSGQQNSLNAPVKANTKTEPQTNNSTDIRFRVLNFTVSNGSKGAQTLLTLQTPQNEIISGYMLGTPELHEGQIIHKLKLEEKLSPQHGKYNIIHGFEKVA